ncbi:MAG: class I SAM-dependent methyltransferase [Chloroflexota bacterium]
MTGQQSSFKEIYRSRGFDYDALVSREDYQGNILSHIQRIVDLDGIDIVEFGAGTGRVTKLLASSVRHIVATDASKHMLAVAHQQLSNTANIAFVVADSRHAPIADGIADLSIAGWCYGHATEWHAGDWQAEIGQSLYEMARVLRPGGTAIILETMGTGSETPAPPNDTLAAYYNWLETEHGFSSAAFRTDYRFDSLDEADKLTRFFFGNELADRVLAENLTTLPECTSIWWKRV